MEATLFDIPRQMHPHSMKAHAETRAKLAGRTLEVLQVIRASGKPMTDREVMHAMGFSDMNAVRPRISECVKSGHLVEVGAVKDAVTGKTVRLVEARK